MQSIIYYFYPLCFLFCGSVYQNSLPADVIIGISISIIIMYQQQ